ncbi:MAG: inosine/xanthosine triphosphatase [Saprospiraceae bacterium]|jgi:inosine/xanthosine triphosphatase
MPKKVIIASKNPVKINAVKIGFERMFPDETFTFEGISVPSGISDQPMTNAETFTGSTNRVTNAKAEVVDADYWVGIEGGIESLEEEMNAYAWIVIKSKDKTGKARTGTFFLPPKVALLVHQGKELGEADDIVFGQSNSKQQGGALGLLTQNVIDRTSLYVEAVIMALIPFKNKNLY